MKTNLISSFGFRPHVRFGFLDFGYSLKSILDVTSQYHFIPIKLAYGLCDPLLIVYPDSSFSLAQAAGEKKKVVFPTYEDVPKLLLTFKKIMNTYRKGSLGQRQRQREYGEMGMNHILRNLSLTFLEIRI